jgi:hypothetical protein
VKLLQFPRLPVPLPFFVEINSMRFEFVHKFSIPLGMGIASRSLGEAALPRVGEVFETRPSLRQDWNVLERKPQLEGL